MSSTPTRCPARGKLNSINRIALKFSNPTMNGMHTNRHHVGLGFCIKALNKGSQGPSLIGMDACQNNRLLEQGTAYYGNVIKPLINLDLTSMSSGNKLVGVHYRMGMKFESKFNGTLVVKSMLFELFKGVLNAPVLTGDIHACFNARGQTWQA
eukprot:1158005-Pelagomonas_calceolata.AAC.7